MRWLAWVLAGPMLWAVVFGAVYGLHGISCAGVTGPDALPAGARALMIGLWVAGLAGHGWLLRSLPAPAPGLHGALPRAGAWIGLGATLITLFPVLMISSC